MSIRRSERWSWVLLSAGAVVALLVGIVGFVNATVVNGDRFAELFNEIRQDDAVQATVASAVTDAAIDAQPDLVAVEPAIDAAAAAIVGSPVLDPVLTPAIRSFHQALTQQSDSGAVLTLADLGATVTTALERFVPQVAAVLPDNLNITLARIGGQTGIAAQIIPVIQVVSTLAWVLPLLMLALMAGGLLLAPHRRVAIVRLGRMLLVVGGALGLGALGMVIASALMGTQDISGAVTSAALSVFAKPLGIRAVAFAVVGGLLVAAAGALLPQVDLVREMRVVRYFVSQRPSSTGWAVARALGIISAGLLIVLFPNRVAAVLAIAAGLVVLFMGITELDAIAERQRAQDEQQLAARRADAMEAAATGDPEAVAAALAEGGDQGPRRVVRWLIPVAAAAAALAVVGALILPGSLPQTAAVAPSGDPEACNGYRELCDRPFDQVMIPASHNSMSIADGTWFLAEQPKDMVASLDDGIRGLLVDTWYGQPTEDGGAITAPKSIAAAEAALTETYGPEVIASARRTIDRVRRSEPVGPPVPYFCHTVCEIGATPMQPVMQRLDAWMDVHPREVVVLFIQDTVTPADTATVLEATGLADRAYVHEDGQRWPTLRELIDSGKQLVVLMENQGGGTEYPYLHQGFDLVQDTGYTYATAADFDCSLNRGSADSPLFMVNHWLASFTKLVSNAEEVNAYDALKARVEQCVAERGKVPNLVAVNWYDRGDLFRVVDEYNGVTG